MTELQETQEYQALKDSFEHDPGFEGWLKACIEDIEETLNGENLDVNILYEIMTYLLRCKLKPTTK